MSTPIELHEEEREKIKEAILTYVDRNPCDVKDDRYFTRDTINNMNNKLFYYFSKSVILMLFFMWLAYCVNVSVPVVAKVDTFLRTFLGSTGQSIASVNFWSAITFLGDKYFVVSLGAIIFLFIVYLKKINLALFFYGGILMGVFVANLFKNILLRARPDGVYGIVESTYAFPSAHALISTVFYGLIAFALFHILKKNWQKILASCFLGVVVLFIGLSRVMIDVHWPTDVIGGWLAGGAVLFTTIALYYVTHLRRERSIV